MRTTILGEISHILNNLIKAVDYAACCTKNNSVRQHAFDISYSFTRSMRWITQRQGGICLPLSKEEAKS
jgi:hypothetical protein